MEEITSNFADFANPDIESIAIIRGRVLQALQQFLLERDFKQLMPILMSPITDPLNHAVYPAELQYEERRLKLTASMIFHKQLALTAKGHDKIFIVAPNIRLENPRSRIPTTTCWSSRSSISRSATVTCIRSWPSSKA